MVTSSPDAVVYEVLTGCNGIASDPHGTMLLHNSPISRLVKRLRKFSRNARRYSNIGGECILYEVLRLSVVNT